MEESMSKATFDIEATFRYYYRPLCLYALHYVHDVDAAEDIVQDCFSALCEKVSVEDVEVMHVKAYLYASCRNRSIDYLKQANLYDMSLSPFELEEVDDEEEAEACAEREAEIWTSIDALPTRCREVFLLNKRDGMTYQEIARQLHISINTVDNHISKALHLLRSGAKKVYSFFFN